MRKKKILFLFRSAPYGSTLAKEGLDAALASAVYEQDLSVLYMDDGVFQLLANQQGELLQQKNIASNLKAFPLYDINQVYVCAESLRERGLRLEELAIDVTALEKDGLVHLTNQQDNLLSF